MKGTGVTGSVFSFVTKDVGMALFDGVSCGLLV